jgi:hypothetical protein
MSKRCCCFSIWRYIFCCPCCIVEKQHNPQKNKKIYIGDNQNDTNITDEERKRIYDKGIRFISDPPPSTDPSPPSSYRTIKIIPAA